MIIDCFIFYNELKMLEFRLEELYEYVDYFIIVESKKTFSGKEKKSFFQENEEMYKKYTDKIINIEVDFTDLNPNIGYDLNPWNNERFQRDSIKLGLAKINLSDDDLIIVSDLDEIPDIETIMSLDKLELESGRSLVQDMYYYNLNTKIDTWNLAVIVPYKILKKYGGPQYVRDSFRDFQPLHRGGWHFSFFGDVNFIINKIKNYSHQEFNNDEFLNIEHVENCIKNQKDIFKRGKENAIMNFIPIEENTYLPKNYHILLDGKSKNKYEDFYFDNLIDLKYVFCVLAIGDRYFEKACNFAKKLNEVSKGHSVVIVSDLYHDKIDNCEIIKLPESEKTKVGNSFNYNLKYLPIKLCSEKEFDYVIYVDADWEIYDDFREKKILKFLNEINKTKYDFVFERPHLIGSKHETHTCFWKHKIEPYGLMETDKYDHGHVCNEQFLVFKNNDKLKIFVNEWSKRNLICIEKNVNPFAEGLEIGMSAIDANMEWTWGYLNIMSSCFTFTSNNGISYSRF